MASVMASTSTTNPDLQRHRLNHSSPPSSFLTTSSPCLSTQPNPLYHSTTSFESVNMEEIIKNLYTEPESLNASSGSVFIDGTETGVVAEARMTLEDFLAKEGVGGEDDVQVPPAPALSNGEYGVDSNGMVSLQFPSAPGSVVHMQNEAAGFGPEAQLGYGNGMVAASAARTQAIIGSGGRSCGGRGKRRGAPAEELVLDKATQQKQKRMIKNRESAARSRERKQAYTVELETLVTRLEEENARLLRQEAEQNKERLKQLMENMIPIEEKRKPTRSLRRVHSMSW